MLALVGGAAAIVADLRAKARLSQRALARAAGVPPSTVSRIESGKADATIGMLDRLARAAGQKLTLITEPAGPSIATVAAASTPSAPHWIAARDLADWVHEHPELAAAAIAEAPARTSPAVDSILAAIAETIAADHGIAAPEWCARIPAAPTEWEDMGTPRMKARARASVPPAFAARRIWIARNAIWRNR